MKCIGRSTDRSAPTSSTSAEAGSPAASTNPPPEFPCRAPGCLMSFDSAMSRELYRRSVRFIRPRETRRGCRKVKPKADRWSNEERIRIAKIEVQLTSDGVESVNQELVKYFDRTLDAIKSQRRRPKHKSLFEQLLMQSQMQPSIALAPPVTRS